MLMRISFDANGKPVITTAPVVEGHTVRLKGVSGESKGLRRYDKENLLWQFAVVIRSDPVGSPGRP